MICVSAVIVGGVDAMSQAMVLAKKPHVVIGKNSFDQSLIVQTQVQLCLYSVLYCVCPVCVVSVEVNLTKSHPKAL